MSLHLKPATAPIRDATAWLIPGADPGAWLEEISRWDVPQERLRLYALPRGVSDRSVLGVLVVPPPGSSPAHPLRAIPFGVFAGKLYLPVDAELQPPIEPAELKLRHAVQIFHPGIGLVGLDAGDALTLAQLFRAPPGRAENWNLARAGVGFNTHLRAVSVPVPAPAARDDLYGEESKEIGAEPMSDLPAKPGEPRADPASSLLRGADRQFSRLLVALLSQFPHTGRQRNWINRLEDWAGARLGRCGTALQSLRDKAINRLLHQLEQDPESGLRHAIPLSRQNNRGVAPPGNQLGTRNPDFNLANLKGGQPADCWGVSAALQQQLSQRYRELANRELQLGRFRRAAYIYAELLGDFEAAASALKQGRHFREAAVLYREYLRRSSAAAVCLAEGGLFAEAIEIYEQEGCFLAAGELYSQIGQPDQAAKAFRKEVDKLLASQDRIGAAKLLEARLAAPEEALAILRAGWPSSRQALLCLEAEFTFLSRYSRHTEAMALLEKLRIEPTLPGLITRLAGLLSDVNSQYPDRQVRHAAADLTRVKASQRLEEATPAEASQLSVALTKLAREDRLLTRDATRFIALQQDRARRLPPPLPARRNENAPLLINTFDLPKGIRWHTIKSAGFCFFAAGDGPGGLVVLRGDWRGNFQQLTWPANPFPAGLPIFEIDGSEARPRTLVIAPGPPPPVTMQAFLATDWLGYDTTVGSPHWLPDDLAAFCFNERQAWLLRWNGQELVLECRDLDGTLITNQALGRIAAELAFNSRPISLLVQRDLVWIAAGRKLFLHREGNPLHTWKAESNMLSLMGGMTFLPRCALARMERGVTVQWGDDLQPQSETICGDLAHPFAAFTMDGSLILLSQREGRICNLHQGGMRLNSFEGLGEPIAVVRAQMANEFAIFTQTGKVHQYRIEAKGKFLQVLPPSQWRKF